MSKRNIRDEPVSQNPGTVSSEVPRESAESALRIFSANVRTTAERLKAIDNERENIVYEVFGTSPRRAFSFTLFCHQFTTAQIQYLCSGQVHSIRPDEVVRDRKTVLLRDGDDGPALSAVYYCSGIAQNVQRGHISFRPTAPQLIRIYFRLVRWLVSGMRVRCVGKLSAHSGNFGIHKLTIINGEQWGAIIERLQAVCNYSFK